MTKPNIILISADQHRADCFGFKGRKVKTPNLDKLASEGTVFSNAITPCVVCMPARSSILTGQLPRTHGLHDNGMDLDSEIGEAGFAGTMANNGYQSAFFGKGHWVRCMTPPTDHPENVHGSEQYGDDWFGPYMGFEHVEMMILGHNWFPFEKPPRGLHYEKFIHDTGRGDELQALYWQKGRDTKGAAQTWHSQLPVEFHNSTWTGDRAAEWIKNGRDDEKPFVTWISFPDPHHPFDCPEPYSTMHDPAEVDLPKHRVRDFDKRPFWHQAAMENEPTASPEMAKVRKEYSRIEPQTDEQLAEIIANTYGQITLIDENVGKILQAVEEAGLSDNTYVIYISDHGDWLGDHGIILKGPMHYEGLLKVPFIVRGPDVPAGETCDEIISTLDLSATFMELSQTSPQLAQHGTSLAPLMRGENAPRDYALNEWYLSPTRAGVELHLRTVSTKTHKLTIDELSGVGEMYDLVADPYEMENIFDAPEAATIRAELLCYIAQRPDDMRPLRVSTGGG